MKEVILSLGAFFSTLAGGVTPEYTQQLQAFSLQDFWQELWEDDDVWTISKVLLRPEMVKDFENLQREWAEDYHRLIDGEFILDEEKGVAGHYSAEVPDEIGTYIFEEDPESSDKYTFREGLLFLSGKNYDLYSQYLLSNTELLHEINQEMEKSIRFACQVCQIRQRVDIPCDMCF